MAEILLYDEIGGFGISAAAFIAQLQAVPFNEPVTLRINSPGGSISEGVAIAQAVGRRGNVTASIDALCASIATVIALAANRVVMADGAMFMIHNASWWAEGDADDLRDAAETLEKFQEAAVAAYTRKTGISRERVLEMMGAETWLTAAEALALGFVDEITAPLSAAAKARAIEHATKRHLTRALAAMNADEPISQPPASPAEPAAPVEGATPPPAPSAEPAEPIVETPAPDAPVVAVDAPAAPAAHVVETDALVAKFRDQAASLLATQQQLSAAQAEVATMKAQLAELPVLKANFARLKSSLGLMPAQVLPVITPAAPDPDDEYVERWNACKTQGEKTRLADEDEDAFRRLSAEGRIKF